MEENKKNNINLDLNKLRGIRLVETPLNNRNVKSEKGKNLLKLLEIRARRPLTPLERINLKHCNILSIMNDLNQRKDSIFNLDSTISDIKNTRINEKEVNKLVENKNSNNSTYLKKDSETLELINASLNDSNSKLNLNAEDVKNKFGIKHSTLGKKLSKKYNRIVLNNELKSNKEILKTNMLEKIENTVMPNYNPNVQNIAPFPVSLINSKANTKDFSLFFYFTSITQYLKEFGKAKLDGIFFNNINNRIFNSLFPIISSFFLQIGCFISKPTLYISNNKVYINLFYYNFSLYFKRNKRQNNRRRNHLSLINKNESLEADKLNILCEALSYCFNKPVELNLTRLSSIAIEPQILSTAMHSISGVKPYRLKRIMRMAFNALMNYAHAYKTLRMLNIPFSNFTPFTVMGMKVRIAGRFPLQKVVPRKTVKKHLAGSFARAKVDFVDNAQYTNKSARGAYTISIRTNGRV